ncbi:MAG: EamA family transporter [Chloroflexota bacterium]
MPNSTPRPSIWLGLLTLYLVWGSTYLGIRIAVETLPPFLMAGARFALAGLVLLGWTALRDPDAIATTTRREWRDSAIVGALLLGGGMGLVAFGEQHVPSGITALLIALMPVWIAVLGWVFLRERLPGLALVGIVVGFVGVAILAGPTITGGSGGFDPISVVALILSPILWATGSLFASHRARLPERPLLATGIQMLLGGLVLFAMAILAGEPARFHPEAVSAASLGAFGYLLVVGSLVAFTTYGWMLRVAPLPLVATYAYVNPVIAVILGGLILQEPIEPRTVVAGAVIVFAVALIVTTRSRLRTPDESARPTDPVSTARPAPISPR